MPGRGAKGRREYSQANSLHQLSCDAGSLDASHEKHTLTVAAHYRHCQALHFALGKPESDEMCASSEKKNHAAKWW